MKILLFVLFTLICFAVSPTATALLPAPSPDGSYPGANTAEGINALHDVNTAVGINNTAVGANALANNTTGYSNVAVGAFALTNNTTGNFNMAIGTEALRDNNANFNLAIGVRVGYLNTTGNHLTGIGAAALRNNTTGGFNTAIGADALRENTTASQNTAIGASALSNNTSGDFNTANGAFALHLNTTGSSNAATGAGALQNNLSGHFNVANGGFALFFNTAGSHNTAMGDSALYYNDTGSYNVAIGNGDLFHNDTDTSNIAIGASALDLNSAGTDNTAIGDSALGDATGSNCIAVGSQAGSLVGSSNNVIAIGSPGDDVDNSCFIGNIRDVQTQNADAISVLVDSAGQLGTVSSSRRFKKEIKPMDKTSEAVLALKPVTFHYKRDTKGIPQFGLVAEDVAEVNPDLVARDKDGEIYTVRYEAVNAMLLNEFLKARRQIDAQQKQIDALTAGLQKVSAQLEVSRPASQVAESNQ